MCGSTHAVCVQRFQVNRCVLSVCVCVNISVFPHLLCCITFHLSVDWCLGIGVRVVLVHAVGGEEFCMCESRNRDV